MTDELHTAITALNTEITERKAAVREREVLNRELNHRTKNNMNVISAMIRLQTAAVDDPEVVTMLQELDARIESMALVHRKLYQSEKLADIDLGEYLDEMADLLRHGTNLEKRGIALTVDAVSVDAPIDIAVPCGLVINELVSNARKHAFPGDKRGTIAITLGFAENGHLALSVSDNGVGLPNPIDPHGGTTLGFRTVLTIVEHQLGGAVRFSSGHDPGLGHGPGPGLTVSAVFPMEQPG